MIRFIKLGWYVSIALFLMVLLWVYSYLPANVGIHADSSGAADQFIQKTSLFYMLLGLFLLTNVVIYVLYKLITVQYLRPGSMEQLPARALKQDLAYWLLGFSATLNLFYIFGMVYLSVFNNPEGIKLGYYAPVVFAGPVLIGTMLVVLIYIFLKKRK